MIGAARRLRIGDLIGSKVVTADGETIGKVAEVRATKAAPHRVTELVVGAAAWLERLDIGAVFGRGQGEKRKPHRVPWDAVAIVEVGTIRLKPGREGDRRKRSE